MTTRKELYSHLANSCNVYLPFYQLDKLLAELKERTEKKESVFTVLAEFETREELRKHNSPVMGAYSLENQHQAWCAASSKQVEQLDPLTGEVLATYRSLYAASKAFGKDGAGNIGKAARTGATMYGFNWRIKEK